MKINSKKNIKIIFPIILVLILFVLVIVIFTLKKENKEEINYTTLENGVKENISEKLNENKLIDNLELKEISLTQNEGISVIKGIILNTGNERQGDYTINLKFVNENGDVISEIPAYISQVEPGKEINFYASSTVECVNAYDVIIERK